MSLLGNFNNKLGKIMSPYDDDDESFEGAEEEQAPAAPVITKAQEELESRFSANLSSQYIDGDEEEEPAKPVQQSGGLIGGMLSKLKRDREVPAEQAAVVSRCAVSVDGDSNVLQFTPADFDEAKELVGYLIAGRTVYLSLESLDSVIATRLMDFISGITYALNGKMTQVAKRAFFITPGR